MCRDFDKVAVQVRWPLTTGVAQGRYYCTYNLNSWVGLSYQISSKVKQQQKRAKPVKILVFFFDFLTLQYKNRKKYYNSYWFRAYYAIVLKDRLSDCVVSQFGIRAPRLAGLFVLLMHS